MTFKIWIGLLACAAIGAGVSLSALAADQNVDKAKQELENANKALQDATKDLNAAQKALEELPDVSPEEVADACASTFSQPQHIEACREAVLARSSGKQPKLSFSEMQDRTLAYMQMVDAGPVGPEQEAKLTPAQKVMWGILYEEDSQAMERLCAHPGAPNAPTQLDLSQKSQEQVAGADPQKVPYTCTNPAAWAKQEAARRAQEREKAQDEYLKP